MKGKMFSLILIMFIILCLSGCGTKKSSDVKVINSDMLGKYELYEITAKETKYTAQRWEEMTSLKYSLEIKKDNTAEIIKASDTKDMEYYSFDKKYFYKKDRNGSDDGKKIFSYEFENDTLKLSMLDGEYNNVYVYKK